MKDLCTRRNRRFGGQRAFQRAVGIAYSAPFSMLPGLGGPQPAETTRILGESRKALAADRAWVGDRRDRLAAAEAT